MSPQSKELIAVVTGGTRGIGLGIAESLIKRGARVAIIYGRDENAAESAKNHLEGLLGNGQKVLFVKGDVGDPGVVEGHHRDIAEQLGTINVLVNNAGIMPQQTLEETSFSDWDEVMCTNLNSAFYWTSEAVPGMKELKFGRIVNISSIAGRIGGMIGPHYAASKAGLLGLTKYSARELGKFGITVNAIAPAYIVDAGLWVTWTDNQKAALEDKVLVSRLGNVGDVVRAFEYLLDSPFVTGVTLDVNGGSFMM
jgi:3-oxoacyl-[acyl-carrier protein] reductase